MKRNCENDNEDNNADDTLGWCDYCKDPVSRNEYYVKRKRKYIIDSALTRKEHIRETNGQQDNMDRFWISDVYCDIWVG